MADAPTAAQQRKVNQLAGALRAPSNHPRTIRSILGDATLDPWALPLVERALAKGNEKHRPALLAAMGRTVSGRRLRKVYGQNLSRTWRQFLTETSRTQRPGPPKKNLPGARRSAMRAVPPEGSTHIPLRDAGAVIANANAAKAKEKAAKAAKRTANKPMRTTAQCRECLKVLSLAAFPNPKVRRCESCGGQPPSRSVRTVSGGAPGLGRRA